MSEPTDFTPAQQAAVTKAVELLGEHFESCLVVVTTELDGRKEVAEGTECYWRGGWIQAIGHAYYAAQRLLTKPRRYEQLPPE